MGKIPLLVKFPTLLENTKGASLRLFGKTKLENNTDIHNHWRHKHSRDYHLDNTQSGSLTAVCHLSNFDQTWQKRRWHRTG